MSYPYQCPIMYANPNGNVAASGYYRSSLTQSLSNKLPPWMHLRQNEASVGQQFISSPAVIMKRLECELNDAMRSKFLTTARVDDIDILYRVRIPDTIDLSGYNSRVTCTAAPSGYLPNGLFQISVSEVDSLEEFYYHVLPTRIEAISNVPYDNGVNGLTWHIGPSGVLDREEEKVDVWGNHHGIMWHYITSDPNPESAASGYFCKQDTDTLEDYEVYASQCSGSVTGMDYYRGALWCISNSEGRRYLSILSTKTQVPNSEYLEKLAEYDISNPGVELSNIVIDEDGTLWVSDRYSSTMCEMMPRYDYFTMDRGNRYLYFREDYIDSGVIVEAA
jgi:hypothetical protein